MLNVFQGVYIYVIYTNKCNQQHQPHVHHCQTHASHLLIYFTAISKLPPCQLFNLLHNIQYYLNSLQIMGLSSRAFQLFPPGSGLHWYQRVPSTGNTCSTPNWPLLRQCYWYMPKNLFIYLIFSCNFSTFIKLKHGEKQIYILFYDQLTSNFSNCKECFVGLKICLSSPFCRWR